MEATKLSEKSLLAWRYESNFVDKTKHISVSFSYSLDDIFGERFLTAKSDERDRGERNGHGGYGSDSSDRRNSKDDRQFAEQLRYVTAVNEIDYKDDELYFFPRFALSDHIMHKYAQKHGKFIITNLEIEYSSSMNILT